MEALWLALPARDNGPTDVDLMLLCSAQDCVLPDGDACRLLDTLLPARIEVCVDECA